MDLNLGVHHCQREEAILTTIQVDKTVEGSEGILATVSRRTGLEPLSDRNTRIRRPGDRVKPNLTLKKRARPPTWT